MLYNITISKLNEVVSFDTAKLPEASVNYVMEYGFKKSINDSHATVKREAYAVGDAGEALWLAEVRKVAHARVDQIRTGQVPRSSGVDPLLLKAATLGLSRAQVDAALEKAAADLKKKVA